MSEKSIVILQIEECSKCLLSRLDPFTLLLGRMAQPTAIYLFAISSSELKGGFLSLYL